MVGRLVRSLATLAAVLLGTAALAAGCGGEGAASGPPDIEVGRTTCAECHMIVSDVRFACAYRTAQGEDRIFDDPGDMLVHAAADGDLDTATMWVHDYDTEKWVDADAAWYVSGGDLESPMGWRIFAFADQSAAGAFADEHGGEVLTWDDLVGLADSGELTQIGVERLPGAGADGHDHADVPDGEQMGDMGGGGGPNAT